MTDGGFRVERTPGGAAGRADGVRAFWATRASLPPDAVEQRLPLVAAVVLDGDDAVTGTCSVEEATIPLVGDRRFWVYRRLVAPDVPPEVDVALFLRVFDDLDAAHEPGAAAPIGLCTYGPHRAEAVLPEVELLHAGYTAQGEQVRVRYFDGALIR